MNLDIGKLQPADYLGDLLEHFGSPTIEAAGNLAKGLPGIFIGVIMALLSAYFFVAERHQLNDWCRKVMPASVQVRYHIIRRSLGKSVGGYFKAQLKENLKEKYLSDETESEQNFRVLSRKVKKRTDIVSVLTTAAVIILAFVHNIVGLTLSDGGAHGVLPYQTRYDDQNYFFNDNN